MKDTRFLPPRNGPRASRQRNMTSRAMMLRGVVHDPTARRMGGVAGHAGLFSTADDLAPNLRRQMLSGSNDPEPRLHRENVYTATARQCSESPRPGLGHRFALLQQPRRTVAGRIVWPHRIHRHIAMDGSGHRYLHHFPHQCRSSARRKIRRFSSLAGSRRLLSRRLTLRSRSKRNCVWRASPATTNRSWPRGVLMLRNGDSEDRDRCAGRAWLPRTASGSSASASESGLVTNQTGDRFRRPTNSDVLAHAPGIKLAAIFSPEHGIAGKLEYDGDRQCDRRRHRRTHVQCLWWHVTQAQAAAAGLAGLDAIVFDIQDIGVRFYTYESTLGYFLEAAAKAGKGIVRARPPQSHHRCIRARPRLRMRAGNRSSAIGRLPCATA